MNIRGIGNFYKNNFSQRNNQKTSFGNGSLILAAQGYYNSRREAIDTTVFSTKRKLTDIEVCSKMLKEERNRFTPKEVSDLNKALGTFITNLNKSTLLRKLLDIKSPSGDKLSAEDIIGFLYVMDETSTVEQKAVLTLLKYELNNYNEQNERVFIPLENCPKMIKEFNKINKLFSDLPEYQRSQLLSTTFDVIKDSNYQFRPFAMSIATKINMDKSAFVYRILTEAAFNLSEANNQAISKKKFKTLLNSFTEEKVKQINEETKNFNSSDQEREYINNYLKEYKIV